MAGRYEQDPIERKSSALADILDSGDGVRAAKILREEVNNMSHRDFNDLVSRTNDKDHKHRGFDMEIVPRDGSIILTGRSGEIYAGRMQDEGRPYPGGGGSHGGSRGRADTCKDQGQAVGEGALKGGALGALAGAVLGDNRKAALKGGVIGAIGGAIYGNETNKNDCEITDNGRPYRR